MVGQDAVTHFCGEDRRKSVDLLDLIIDHFTADDDMADELSLLRIVILGESGELADLADVVQQGDTHQQVALEKGVTLAVEVAELGNSQCVLAQAPDKAVVDGLCSRGYFERFDKFRILHKEHFQQSLQMGVFNGVHKLQDRLEHVLDIAL